MLSESNSSARAALIEQVRLDLRRRWQAGLVDPEAQTAQFHSPGEVASWTLPPRPRLEDYLAQLPELGPLAELPLELIAEEYRARQRGGDRPGRAEYLARFGPRAGLEAALHEVDRELGDETLADGVRPTAAEPAALRIRCPGCHGTIVLADGAAADELHCAACGRQFSLTGDETLDHVPGEPATTLRRRLGHFELLEPVGSGAAGTVWRARDTQLDRIVAVKIPRKEDLTRADTEKFLREARTAARLSHPSIVAVHEVGVEHDTLYIVSDFIEGVSLDRWLADRRLTHPQAAELAAQIADALEYAHQRGVVHRDLKPGNILMDAAGRPHLTDFGLAKREQLDPALTVEGQIMGTPAYMSPEQARGEGYRADRRSDVYSLGVVLFELLTRERPFRGNVRMLLRQVAEDDPPSPRRLDGSIPVDLETICLKCLRKEPRTRYGSAAELADELRRFLRGEPIRARPVGLPEKAWRWCRRYPQVAGLSATAALLLVGLLASISVAYVREAALRRQTDQQREQAESSLYLHRIALAHQKWLAGDVGQAEELLDACPADRRQWEWGYLKHLCHLDLQTLRGHRGAVTSAAWRPDGRQVATGGSDGTIRLWEPATGKLVRTLPGHQGWVRSVAYSPDGRRLVSGGYDAQATVWDVAAGRPLRVFRGHARPVMSVAFDPTGRRVVSASSDTTVKLWDSRTGRELRTLQQSRLGLPMEVSVAAAFSPDGQLVAASDAGALRLWRADDGREVLTLRATGGSIAFSADGRRIAAAGGEDVVRVWDAATGDEVFTLAGHSAPVKAVTFSLDGQFVATGGSDRTLRVYAAADGRELRTLRGHTEAVWSVAFSPDGGRLVSAGWDGTARLWDATTQRQAASLAVASPRVAALAFSPDGMLLAAAGSDGALTVWDAGRLGVVHSFDTGQVGLYGLAFTPDGRRLASAGEDQTVALWDPRRGARGMVYTGHGGPVTGLAYGLEGRWLVAVAAASFSALDLPNSPIPEAGWREEVIAWEAATGRRRWSSEGASCVAVDPRGRFVAAGDGRSVRILDAATGRPLHQLDGHAASVMSLVWSGDGGLLASAGEDQTIRLWDAAGRPGHVLRGHGQTVWAVAFHPGGRRLSSVSDDGQLKLWDVASGQEVLTIDTGLSGTEALALDPAGGRLATAGAASDGACQVKVWDVQGYLPAAVPPAAR